MKEIEQLNNEITELQNTVVNLNQKLQQSEALKSNFISNIMNEIYNPFSSILCMADNMINIKNQQLDQVVSMAKVIHREASQLDFHLQNVFTAAKLEAGLEVVELSEINFVMLLSEVLSSFSVVVDDHQLTVANTISSQWNGVLISDSPKLSLVLANILSNAIKNSPPGGTISISTQLVGEELKVEISDEGPGMGEDEIQQVFDRFIRIDNTINSVNGGTGLGLSVVKAIVELLKGDIHITSDKGTHVILDIPTKPLAEDFDSGDELFVNDELF